MDSFTLVSSWNCYYQCFIIALSMNSLQGRFEFFVLLFFLWLLQHINSSFLLRYLFLPGRLDATALKKSFWLLANACARSPTLSLCMSVSPTILTSFTLLRPFCAKRSFHAAVSTLSGFSPALHDTKTGDSLVSIKINHDVIFC